MRRRIIESLTYPRMLMMSRMDLRDCPMNLYFNSTDKACQTCAQESECRWLKSNDEFSVLVEKPMEVLFEAFVFSIDYIDAHVSQANHNSRRCSCETCIWVRDARYLARQHRGHSKNVPRS